MKFRNSKILPTNHTLKGRRHGNGIYMSWLQCIDRLTDIVEYVFKKFATYEEKHPVDQNPSMHVLLAQTQIMS